MESTIANTALSLAMLMLKLVIFHLMHFADIVRCVAFCIKLIIIINHFLMTQRQMTLKDICGHIIRKLHHTHV